MIGAASATTSRARGRGWLYASYGYAALVAAGLGYFLLRIPIQVTDCFQNMLALGEPFGELMRQMFMERSYLRPGLWAHLKIVYDLSGGAYFEWYRLTHVAQAAAVIVLFVRLAQPRTAAAALALPIGLAALIGSHTIAWTLREAFPINAYLTIVLCCAAAANLAFARHRWWVDVLAVALFAGAVLSVESGVLVWVVFTGGYLLGLRGVSRRGIIALAIALAAYFALRAALATGTPDLTAREAGFGFSRRSGGELVALFGDNPVPFYAYNVVSSILGVLFAEPRDGVWRLTQELLAGTVAPPRIVNVVASTLATLLIGAFAWTRRRAWLSRRLDRGDQIVLLFVGVLGANATISFAYTKDVIMSPAGLFFAWALFVAVCSLLDGLPRIDRSRAVVAAVVLAVLSCTWAIRAAGIHAALARTAFVVREQWTYVDDWLARSGFRDLSPAALALKQQLQDDAVVRHPPTPQIAERWTVLFDIE